jgi:hypothetical protein
VPEGPRFFKFLGGDRRSGERRGGDPASGLPASEIPGQRRQRDRRSDGTGRRLSERRPVPFGTGSPSGALINPTGQSLHVSLWDVSEGGLCVVTRGTIEDPPGTLMVLELGSGVGVHNVRIEMQLVWSAAEEGGFGTFVGLQFPEGQTLPNGTFLDRYLTMELPN